MHHHQPTLSNDSSEKAWAETAHEHPPRPQPQIYVASLADYSNGRLHGEWLDATRDAADIHADITAMLARSKEPDAEEFAIHDYEQFGICRIHEYDSIERVSRIAKGIHEHGDAFSAYVDLVGADDATDAGFSDAYHGTYQSFRAFVDEFKDSLGWDDELERIGAQSGLAPFISFDYELFETTIRGEWSVVDGPDGIHVFSI